MNETKKFKTIKELRDWHFANGFGEKNHKLPYSPRWINKVYAFLHSYFWLPCPMCGRRFGGHEWYGGRMISGHESEGICPKCTIDVFNKTGCPIIPY